MEKKELTAADVWAMFAETRLQMAETDRKIDRVAEGLTKTEQLFDRLGIKVNDMNSRVEGIGNSNGKFAEEYFFNSLERKMEFAGVHYDGISRKFGLLKKTPDGKRIKDQFDIIMLNGDSVAIIEIKYKAENDYPQKMVAQKVPNFRFLYPEFSKHKIYLGLGGFSFEEEVIEESKKLGIGLLKQVGDSIEYETGWVMVY
ncbi:hypothetical protein R83H12_02419 [Fibrobacteria bacterium R8-3-H12]